MKELVEILGKGFESIDCKVVYADVFEEFMEETGELEIFYGNISYCVNIYHAEEQLPGMITFDTTPSELEPLFLAIKKTVTDNNYTLDKYGVSHEKELFLRLSLEKKHYHIYIEKIESSKTNYGLY